jgi:hypothetical protein
VPLWRVPDWDIFLPKLIEEALGAKVHMVLGYGGGGDMNLAMEKGEVHCRAGTVSAYVSREPSRTWLKKASFAPSFRAGQSVMQSCQTCQHCMS